VLEKLIPQFHTTFAVFFRHSEMENRQRRKLALMKINHAQRITMPLMKAYMDEIYMSH